MREVANAAKSRKTYIPAAGYDLLLPLYDLITKWSGADRVRQLLLDQAPLRPDARVLEVGCGTGSLAVQIRKLYPEVEIVGLDPDPKALARACRKAERAGVKARFDEGFSQELEYPPASFDAVFSTFMFHHLQLDEKRATLREIRRVLKPGGSLYLLDFELPKSASGWHARAFHSFEEMQDNSEAKILEFMSQAGFAEVRKLGEVRVLLGLSVAGQYRATAPKVGQ